MSKLVFVPDKLKEDALEVVRAAGLEVDYRPDLPLEEKIAAARGAHALIIRSATRVTAEFLEACEQLELIVRAGVGVDNIDVEAATRRGVVVQNVPEGNVRSAAEHTIALLMSMARNVPQAHLTMKDGRWDRAKFTGVEVQGKTLAIVGLGKIGRHVARMASGLGFQLVGFDPYLAAHMAADLKVELIADLKELSARADFLTVHVPSTPQTKGIIGAEVLAAAKPGLRLVNCARGGIVDEEALLAALESGTVAQAALDVYSEEPPGPTPLVMHPAVVVTPHLGASTTEAQETVAMTGAQQVVDYLLHRKLHSPVNAANLDPTLAEEMGPYHELAVRLGRAHAQLLQGNPERVVVKYFGELFDERVQSFLTNGVLCGFIEGRAAQPVNAVNARTLAKEQGLALEESVEGKSRYFADLVRVEVTDSAGTRELGGATRGRRGLRLVSLDGYHFDAVLEGTLVISANEDRPGMIGAIGSVLASHNLNVSNMALGRDRTGGTAISLVNLDAPVDPRVLDDLRATDGILWARAVDVESS